MTKDEIIKIFSTVLFPFQSNWEEDQEFKKFRKALFQCLIQKDLFIKNIQLLSAGAKQQPLTEEWIERAAQIEADINAPETQVWINVRKTPQIGDSNRNDIEDFLEAENSFGPFLSNNGEEFWFDFYEIQKKILFTFDVIEGAGPVRLAITLPGEQVDARTPGNQLKFSDCSLWIPVENNSNQFVSIRAKQCELTFESDVSITREGQVLIPSSASFTAEITPAIEKIPAETDPIASFPKKIIFQFNNEGFKLKHFGKATITRAKNEIHFNESADVAPASSPDANMLYFPIKTDEDKWAAKSLHSFVTISGETMISNTGWYLPLIVNGSPDLKTMGKAAFSGYLGFTGTTGIETYWDGLQNANVRTKNLLALFRHARCLFKFMTAAGQRSKQSFEFLNATHNYSNLQIKPVAGEEGDTGFSSLLIYDTREIEFFLAPVEYSASICKPVDGNGKRFTISKRKGIIMLYKTSAEQSLVLLGIDPGAKKQKRRIPLSLSFNNALLTVDDPMVIVVNGKLNGSAQLSSGICKMLFPVYRVINTLPDPYLSNQIDVFSTESMSRFNELWNTDKDLLPDKALFRTWATMTWSKNDATVSFATETQHELLPVPGKELFDKKQSSTQSPCPVIPHARFKRSIDSQILNNRDALIIARDDIENLVGAYGFLSWLPGQRQLLDISGRTNRWGISFTHELPEDSPYFRNANVNGGSLYGIEDNNLVVSARLARLFLLPHIQWEPVVAIENIPSSPPKPPEVACFNSNGAATRISTAQKADVILDPGKMFRYFIKEYQKADHPDAMAAHFTLPFGICSFAYFNPSQKQGIPYTIVDSNQPNFTIKGQQLLGGMQLQVVAKRGPGMEDQKQDEYLVGTCGQLPFSDVEEKYILGNEITLQFNGEFFFNDGLAKVPVKRIDFSGYGASIFSNWLNGDANFGRVSQVKFDVLLGRTAHEVVQIKSILFPWGVPVVRSIIIQRKNHGIVIRQDSGWIANGPGEFNFLSYKKNEENPYKFHPGIVSGIYNVTSIRDTPGVNDITIGSVLFSAVYFNGDIKIDNVVKGANSAALVPSRDQYGYVMLADTATLQSSDSLETLFPPESFWRLLNDPKTGGSLGGPVDCIIKIAGTEQRMHISRVDVSASLIGPSFVAAAKGTIELPKEGSWSVIKCTSSKDVVPLNASETVPLIRHGLLDLKYENGNVTKKVLYKGSRFVIGNPTDINAYSAPGGAPELEYALLHNTDTQKILFRQPAFSEDDRDKIFTQTPDLADPFSLLSSNAIFPSLAKTFSLPPAVKELRITGDGKGLKLADELFQGPDSLKKFIPSQLNSPSAQKKYLINESAFKVYIDYNPPSGPSTFKVDLDSETNEPENGNGRKKWEFLNKGVSIGLDLGPFQPLFRLTGEFHAEAGRLPQFKNPSLEFGSGFEEIKSILQILATLTGKDNLIKDSLKIAMSNSPDAWNYKMSIEQRIPVLQFPSAQLVTLAGPPPLIIEASLLIGTFFNLSLSPKENDVLKPGAGAVFGFEGMMQVLLLSIEIAAVYGAGVTRLKVFVDVQKSEPEFEFTFGFAGTVIIVLPVIGMVSVTRAVMITSDIRSGNIKIMAGQMLRGVVSLAGGLLITTIQIEASGGIHKATDPEDGKEWTNAVFEMVFTLNVSLAFVISYDFTERWQEKVKISSPVEI